MQESSDGFHLGLLHGSRGQGSKTNSNTTGNLGRGVTGNGVLVDGDVAFITNLFNLGTGQSQRSQVPEDQVVVGTVSLELVFVAGQDLGNGSSVGNDLLSVCLEGGVGSLLECNGDTGNGLA